MDKKIFDTLPDMLGISQAARALGITREAIYKAIERNKLSTVQVGPYRVIPKAELERYMTHKGKPGRPRKIRDKN
jgi:excisionase family DNA binding protein